jgi:predicted Zn-dependent peptidase
MFYHLKKHINTLYMELTKIGKLDNGLEYIVYNNKSIYTVSLVISVKVGSIDEDISVSGISHVLEHMIFKSNNKYKSKYALYKELDSLGANFNAYTDKNITTYYVKTHYNYFEKLVEMLSSLICNPNVSSDEFNIEKKIINEEIKNSYDEPSDIIYNKLFSLIYPNTPIARDIAGTTNIIDNMTIDQINQHLNTFYKSNNMVISIVGNIPDNYLDILKKSDFLKPNLSLNQITTQPKYTPTISNQLNLIEKESLNQFFLGIGFPLEGHDDANKYIIKLISAILSGSMSSRLFMELRENQGLVYSIKTDIAQYYQGGIFYIITSFDKDYYLKVISSIMTQLQLIINVLVSNDEINVWKNNIKNSLVIEFENTMEVADYYAKQMLFFRNNITEYSLLNDKFTNITDQEILNVAKKLFNFSNMKTILLGNFGLEKKIIIENITKIIKSHL